MDIFLWIVVLSLFALSFMGLVFPILPSVLAVWGGFLVYTFFINSQALSPFFWIGMIALTFILLIANVLANQLAVRKFGGSKLGEKVAAVSVIVGAFIYPPIGMIVLPFVAVYLIEWVQRRNPKEALQVATGSLIGFFSGQVAEGLIQAIMIGWFFLSIWL
ncbi:DUF456 domain-containing protein [Lacticigenium naphthae]|uniref:DUF456 domain-containing protein n=1 Tax=Lacticigenium naphthae TaxID=515351 RepID=UPI000404BB10|nr:DUF456 domain-containing protein [Lacticigenium naphthae]